jgi:hypothetical protein
MLPKKKKKNSQGMHYNGHKCSGSQISNICAFETLKLRNRAWVVTLHDPWDSANPGKELKSRVDYRQKVVTKQYIILYNL